MSDSLDSMLDRIEKKKLQIQQEHRGLPQPLQSRVGHIGSGTIGVNRRAKTQQSGDAAGASGYISVKLLNVDGVEVGDAFNAYILPSGAAVDPDDYLPIITDDHIILVTLDINGKWYFVNPTLIPISQIQDLIDASIATINCAFIQACFAC